MAGKWATHRNELSLSHILSTLRGATKSKGGPPFKSDVMILFSKKVDIFQDIEDLSRRFIYNFQPFKIPKNLHKAHIHKAQCRLGYMNTFHFFCRTLKEIKGFWTEYLHHWYPSEDQFFITLQTKGFITLQPKGSTSSDFFIVIDYIFRLYLRCFLLPIIMDWSFPTFVFIKLILHELKRLFVTCYEFPKMIVR